ncbi:ABC transporter substrate-binding protein [Streptomyces scopuliridis]|uniref:ABC transporter substrate-binding protein n=2 Tax=Streptomyces scopuliridis TaxID=452529 RepID=A0ACD4ZGM8_9ACTN|nr:ABC transporter substrate-binding protein [Streptomyces scopuliridis]WSB97181.1 ABC transporter substrate-binding protein [Streptomyces scopuliridis]WSC09115.1 ABC transporter substrate-binding protein [Streptomyces scopuliridis]
MWTFKQSHVAALRAAAEKFTAETGTKVNIQAVTPDDAFLTKVQAAARTNDLPDVLEVHANGDDLAFGGAGLLEDLSKDVDQKWLAQYLPQVLTDGTVTPDVYKASLTEGSKTQGVQLGQRFSVPLTVGTQGVVYMNKSRAAKAGVTRAPATWEEFIDALDKVTKAYPDNGGVTVGVKQPSTALEWLMQPMAFGMLGKQKFEALFGPDTAQGWSSPNGQKVLNTYNEVTPYWKVGAVLAQFTPLKSRSAESTGAQMSSMLKSYWAEQNK